MSDTATSSARPRRSSTAPRARRARRPPGSRPTRRTSPTSSPRSCSRTPPGSWTRAAPPAARRRRGPGAGARPRPRDRGGRPPVRGQQGGALPARHARDRQAVPRGARRGPGDHRHLRLLHRRGPAPVRPDRPVGDARQAALHVPRPGRRRRDHHRRQLPRRGPVLVPRAGDPVRQRGRVEAGRVLRGDRDAMAQIFHAGGVPGGVLNLVQADGARRSRASSARSSRASSTRSASPAPPRSARRSARCAAATRSRRASSSAARTRWS